MAKVKEGLFYNKEGMWVKVEGNKARIGLSDPAQDELGEVIYVQTPVIDREVYKGDEIGALESFKSIIPIVSPVEGKIVSVNRALEENPSLINTSPYEEGWLAELELSSEVEGLCTAEEYKSL